MKVLVTGYKGFIGQNLCKALKEEHEVVGYEWGQPVPDVSGMDWVIHLGAISSTTEQRVDYLLKQNLESSIHLYEDCIKNNVNFQFSSSASVYGLVSDFKETSKLSPQNHYARSKAMFERYVELRDAPIITQMFRYFNVHGPCEDHKGEQASPHSKFTKQAESTGKIKLFEGSENFLRDFIHVDQVVEYHKRFLGIKESGIWNFGTGNPVSFYEVALQVAKDTNAKVEFVEMPKTLKDHYQKFTKADTAKISEALSLSV
jgi:ADP-L-glycero-D-manno-heptose 6-epimerase